MKVITEEEHIPAKTFTITKYVATDGTEFHDRKSCERYERRLEIMKHPVIATRIEGLYTFDEEYQMTLYYISNEEDYLFLTSYWISNKYLDTDFFSKGPGWYLFYSIDGGGGPDFYHLFHYDTYEKETQERWEDWKTSVRSKIKG